MTWWWIDYLEDEIGPSLEKDMELLLHHSTEDRDAFENFRLLKSWLKESDPARDHDVESRLPRLRRRIMNAIEEAHADSPPGAETRTRADWTRSP